MTEKPNLLPPRPLAGAALDDGTAGAHARAPPETRRPADMHLSAWTLGSPAAVDLAVTSGLQMGLLEMSAGDGGLATEVYAAHKRSHLRTAELCEDAGIIFIIEAEGGLGADACGVLRTLARDASRLTAEPPSVRASMATQSLAVSLQRSNALAILRRAPSAAPPLSAPLAAARDQLMYAAAAQPTTTHTYSPLCDAVTPLSDATAAAAGAAPPPPVAHPPSTPAPTPAAASATPNPRSSPPAAADADAAAPPPTLPPPAAGPAPPPAIAGSAADDPAPVQGNLYTD